MYVAPFPEPGRKRRISTAGAAGYARWRPDGRELYYLDRDRHLIAVPVSDSGPEFEVGAAKALFEIPVLTRRNGVRYIYDVSTAGRPISRQPEHSNHCRITHHARRQLDRSTEEAVN